MPFQMIPEERIKEKVSTWLERHQVTKSHLARWAGVARTPMQQWLDGKPKMSNPSIRWVNKILAGCNAIDLHKAWRSKW